MLLYHVLIKDRYDPGVNIREKASAASANRAGGLLGAGCSETLSLWAGILGEPQRKPQSPLRKLAGSKEHLDWLKIDLNVAKIITAQNYKDTKS